jgi:hypothetical protein
MNADQIVKKQEQLLGERTNFTSLWQECGDFARPEKASYTTTRSAGAKVCQALFDSTAANGTELLAGALHGMLTNPSSIFFDLRTGDSKLDQDEEIRQFCQESVEKITHVLNNSNFQTEVHELYLDLTTPGTAAMAIEEDDESVVRFATRPLNEIVVDENNKGQIDTVIRQFEWDARQIAQEFGEDKLPAKVKKAYLEGTPEKFAILHAIYPRNLKKVAPELRKVPKGYPIASKYVLKADKIELDESGFHEWPMPIPRWVKIAGEKYGRSPTMKAMADTKMINKMKETTIRAAQKATDPPLQAPDDGFIDVVSTAPDTVNYYRSGSSDRIETIYDGARVDFGFQLIEDTKKAIRQAYYVDQLQLDQGGPQMTATEVDRRTEDALRLMGPMLGRLQSEFLQPMIDRVWGIMVRKKLIVIPDSVAAKLSKKKLLVQYSSLVARAQRIAEGNNLNRTIQAIAPVVNADPTLMDLIDGEKYIKHVADIYGFPFKLFRDEKAIKKIREARAEAQAKAQKQADEAHQAEQVGKALPAVAQAQMAAQQKGVQ